MEACCSDRFAAGMISQKEGLAVTQAHYSKANQGGREQKADLSFLASEKFLFYLIVGSVEKTIHLYHQEIVLPVHSSLRDLTL